MAPMPIESSPGTIARATKPAMSPMMSMHDDEAEHGEAPPVHGVPASRSPACRPALLTRHRVLDR